MFSYFLLTLLLVSTLCLSVVYAVVEADDIHVYLQKVCSQLPLYRAEQWDEYIHCACVELCPSEHR